MRRTFLVGRQLYESVNKPSPMTNNRTTPCHSNWQRLEVIPAPSPRPTVFLMVSATVILGRTAVQIKQGSEGASVFGPARFELPR